MRYGRPDRGGPPRPAGGEAGILPVAPFRWRAYVPLNPMRKTARRARRRAAPRRGGAGLPGGPARLRRVAADDGLAARAARAAPRPGDRAPRPPRAEPGGVVRLQLAVRGRRAARRRQGRDPPLLLPERGRPGPPRAPRDPERVRAARRSVPLQPHEADPLHPLRDAAGVPDPERLPGQRVGPRRHVTRGPQDGGPLLRRSLEVRRGVDARDGAPVHHPEAERGGRRGEDGLAHQLPPALVHRGDRRVLLEGRDRQRDGPVPAGPRVEPGSVEGTTRSSRSRTTGSTATSRRTSSARRAPRSSRTRTARRRSRRSSRTPTSSRTRTRSRAPRRSAASRRSSGAC